MKYVRLVFGLALLPLCTWLGSLVPLGTGSGIVIGLLLGFVLSYLYLRLFLAYGLGHQHQVNGEGNQQAGENTPFSLLEAGPPLWWHQDILPPSGSH
jgi:hypothetical protein